MSTTTTSAKNAASIQQPMFTCYSGHKVNNNRNYTIEYIISTLTFSADLTIYAGDLNTEPKDIPYQLGT